MKALQLASLAAGLVIARAGLANVLPTYGVLPRTGSFALDWFRPLFSWLCFLSFLIWDALRQAREGKLTALHAAAYAVALGLMSWICYEYDVIAKVLKDSFMFFSAREAWLAGIAYYASFFLAVFFEAEKQGISAAEDDEPIEAPDVQDWINLLLVFGPIALIVWLLASGLSPARASIAAILMLFPMSLVNPAIRRHPWKLAEGGKTVAQLAVAIAIVGNVVSTLNATGIPTKFAVLLASASSSSLMAALLIAAAGCIVLGVGMPTLPAYIAIVAVMGPTLTGFGVELLTPHMFVVFFGVPSVITPPVAIAAYAAASISKRLPIGTAVEATRIGAMIFLVPFAFVYTPALLLGTKAAAAAPVGHQLFSLLALAASPRAHWSASTSSGCRSGKGA
ncbi:TRAP transporter large permease subunit [uncultured Salipiger sp.]|uniref:TRAP transporter large permease subunit n=1 Tax=uncultured Salipiger sp. TaxID=499810 RepID=UPI00259A6F29|nr:TRAP transporter large permease subunit [uncultured Salipiger sp.]